MARVVTFNEEAFRAMFPAFSDETRFPDAMLTTWFNTACEIVGNNDGDIIPYDTDANLTTRLTVLYFTLCHLLTINFLWDSTQAGAVTNAAEGSVSAGFALNDPSWWNSTKCGAQAYFFLERYSHGGEYYGIRYLNSNG